MTRAGPDRDTLNLFDQGGPQLFTVAICTRNRSRALHVTLQSLAACDRPVQHELEVLVVASTCTDDTVQVVEQHRAHLPIRVIHEPLPGHSRARNAAVGESRGRLIIWTDDDVRVGREWLTAYERALLAWPTAKIFGGAVLPVFEPQAPGWLTEAFPTCDSAFAARSVPFDAPIEAASGNVPFGANFAIDGDVQRSRAYDTRLGRRPGRWMVGGEELDVINAALQGGAAGRWVAGSVVEHIIQPDRQTVAYLRAYFEGHGYLLGREEQKTEPPPRLPFGELRAMVGLELRFRVAKQTESPVVWVRALIDSAVARGKFSGRRAVQDPAPTL